jgi:dTDP-4-amino-4,6-dideoxygalactose transaminase
LKQNHSAYHLYIVQNKQWSTEKKLEIFNEMRAQGIQVHIHYIPIHLQPFYQNMGFKQGDFPVAEAYYQQSMTLPLHPNLTFEQQSYIIDKLLNQH